MPTTNIQWKAHKDGPARGVLVLATEDIHIWPEDEMTHGCYLRERLDLDYGDVACFYIGLDYHSTKARWVASSARLEMYELNNTQARLILARMPNILPPTRWDREDVAA